MAAIATAAAAMVWACVTVIPFGVGSLKFGGNSCPSGGSRENAGGATFVLLLMMIPPPVDWCTVLAMAVAVVVVVTTLFSWSIIVTVWSTPWPLSMSLSSSLVLLLLLRWALVNGAATAAAAGEELVGSAKMEGKTRVRVRSMMT